MIRVVTVCRAALVLSLLSASPVHAQDPTAAQPLPSDSSGMYAGIQGGGFGGSPALFRGYSLIDGSGSHFAGFDVGYDRAVRSRVTIGMAADVSFAAEPVAFTGEAPALFGSLRARLGYTRRRWLFYSTGGFAWTRDQLASEEAPGGARYATRAGWALGGGVERSVAPHWRVSADYLYSRFAVSDTPAATDSTTNAVSMQQLRVGLQYTITPDRSPDERFPGVEPLLADGWSVHGQTTYVNQYAPPFRAPYRGPNSLDPDTGRETWDVTLYVARQLWSGAALWINPEIDQGYGLSNTLGVAGFTSGEAYKVGYTHPYVRVPRMFVQQTIDMGGAHETVEAGLNQFPASRAADRLVITVGKFSVSDLFDTISYAHDPRSDFMNWSLVDAGTFDYAADAWGFTYGAALEWYRRQWAVRAAFFDLSSVPNSVDLNPHFAEYQTVYELEHRHAIRDRTGKISLVGFVSRGRMGRFDDAVTLANTTGEPADIAAVRRENSRPGVNLNVEQQISAAVGIFGRAGWADGSLEPYEFADIDRTASAGMSASGARWGRATDTLGIAAVVNDISTIHRAYLNAGGLGILVGDGRLPHAGSERILETYYRMPFGSWQVTADYQLVINPAYNQDRGPVSVLSLRLHSQF